MSATKNDIRREVKDDTGCLPKKDSATHEELMLSHCQYGYQNAQETIRAMDTKVSVLTGLAIFALTAIGGILGAVLGCLGDHPEYLRAVLRLPDPVIWLVVALGLVVIGNIGCGIVCIVRCVDTLRARNRIEGLTDVPATVLFPYLNARGKQTTAEWLTVHKPAKQYYDRIVTVGLQASDIRKEYYDQILNVGAILGEKITHFRNASRWFRYQIASAGIVLVMLVITAGVIGLSYRHTVIKTVVHTADTTDQQRNVSPARTP